MTDWWTADPVTAPQGMPPRAPVDIQVRLRGDTTPLPTPQRQAPDAQPSAGNWWDSDPESAPAAAQGPALNAPQGMLNDVGNQQLAWMQGTTPNTRAHAPNLLGNVELDEADRAVFKDSEGKLQPFDPSQHVMLRDADGKLKIYSRAPDTNEGMLSSLGRFVLAGSGAGALAAPARIPQAIAATNRLGIDVPRAITTTNPLTRFVGQALSKMPGGGGLHTAIEEGVGELGEAAQKAIERSGGTPDANVAGASFSQGIEQSFKPQLKAGLGRLYDAVDAGVDQNMLHRLDNTTQTAGDIAGAHASYGDQWTGEGAKLIRNAIQRPGLTYSSIKNLRSRIGEMLDSSTFPEGTSETELRKLYGGLSDDLRTAVSNAGSPQALADFERANSAAAKAQEWKDSIAKVLGTAKRSNEGVAATLYRMAGKGESADINSLTTARAAVPQSAWQDLTANAISRLGKDNAGNFSPLLFVRDYGNLSAAGKRILFGGAGKDSLIPHLDDIATVSNSFKQAGKFANVSGTAGHATLGVAMFESVRDLLGGEWKAPLAAVGSAIGAAATAKLLGMPATVASVARWSRAYRALATNPGPAAIRSYDLATRNLASIAAAHVDMPPNDIQERIRQNAQRQE